MTDLYLKREGRRVEVLFEGRYGRWQCHVLVRFYTNGRLRLDLIDCEEGSPVAVITVNLPEQELVEGEIIIKDYSENEGMLDSLLGANLVSRRHRWVNSGHVQIPVVRWLPGLELIGEGSEMKTYVGYRFGESLRPVVKVHDTEGSERDLDPRLDLRNHSPAGFEWGYGGSGPAQLALALAADVLEDDERARAIYQRLKFRVVGRLSRDGWSLTEEELLHQIEELEAS